MAYAKVNIKGNYKEQGDLVFRPLLRAYQKLGIIDMQKDESIPLIGIAYNDEFYEFTTWKKMDNVDFQIISREEFISLLASTFFLTKKMKKNIELIYYDEENYEYFIEEENYSESIDEAKEITLNFKSSENEKAPELDKFKEKCENLIKSQINNYQKNLEEICRKSALKKLEEVDKKHQEELENIQKFYQNKLNDIKDRTLKQSQNIYNKIQDQSGEMMVNKLEEYNKNLEKEMDELIKEKQNSVINKINEIDFKRLEKIQMDMGKIVENNKKELEKAINKK